jgi:hypothetical protein
MKLVYSAANIMDAQIKKDHLESAGIEVIVQGEYLTGAIGELPADTYPTVWVVDDADESRAKAMLEALADQQASQLYEDDWTCSECGEKIAAQFTQCWQCGHIRNS